MRRNGANKSKNLSCQGNLIADNDCLHILIMFSHSNYKKMGLIVGLKAGEFINTKIYLVNINIYD